jgi:hypothetical protein
VQRTQLLGPPITSTSTSTSTTSSTSTTEPQ